MPNSRQLQARANYDMSYQGQSQSYQAQAQGTQPKASVSTSILPGVIGGIFNLGSSLIQSGQQRRNVRDQNQARREEAERAHERDIEMWHMQNEYNHPANQQARLQEAGLNPHLMYGQGDPGNAAQMPQYHPADMQVQNIPGVDPSGMLEGFLQASQRSQDLKTTQAQELLNRSTVDVNYMRTDGLMQENIIRSLEATITEQIIKLSKEDGRSIKEIAQGRIGGMKADDWLRQATADIKKWEASLAERGIRPQDALLVRIALDFFEFLGFEPSQIKKYMEN